MAEIDELKILLIEDDPTDAALFKALLGHTAAFERLHAPTLAGAREVLDSSDVDVVLLDLGLPDADSDDTFALISELSSSHAVIVLTGNDSEVVAFKALQEGAQDFLVKDDVTETLLAKAIRYAVERHKTASAVSARDARNVEVFTAGARPDEALFNRDRDRYQMRTGDFRQLLVSIGDSPEDTAATACEDDVRRLAAALVDDLAVPVDIAAMYAETVADDQWKPFEELGRLVLLRLLIAVTLEYRRRLAGDAGS